MKHFYFVADYTSRYYLKDPIIFNALYSSDSAAWNFRVSKHSDKTQAVQDYQRKLSLLLHNQTQELLK